MKHVRQHLVIFWLFLSGCHTFAPNGVPSSTNFKGQRQCASLKKKTLLGMVDSESSNTQHDGRDEDWIRSQRKDLQNVLEKIDTLQYEMNQVTFDDTNNREASNSEDIDRIESMTDQVEQEVNELLSRSMMIPPKGLPMTDFQDAIRTFWVLPPPARLAICRALELDDDDARNPARIPKVVAMIHENRYTLTPQKLQDSLKAVQQAKVMKDGATDAGDEADEIKNALYDFIGVAELSPDERALQESVNATLPRVTRKENQLVSSQDLKVLTDVLDKSIFETNAGRPVKIPGGYILRGVNKLESGKALIERLDEKLPKDWDCVVCYLNDATQFEETFLQQPERSALFLFKKDWTPKTSVWAYRLLSVSAIVTTLLFSIGIYGSNDVLISRLSEAAAIGDYSAVDLFNAKIGEFLLPLFVILGSRELGRFLVAKKEGIETLSLIPTFLPFWSNLPLLGSLNRITNSPKSLTSLFDYAFTGTLLGFVSSFIMLGTGLLAMNSIPGGDVEASILPALPVSVIKLSTLGSSVLDNFFGGAGVVTGEALNTPISLHPYAVAGYVGLLISAVELLPLGATDGGRLSIAMFGRQKQSIIGAVTWLVLLVSSFQLESNQSSLLITAWAVNNLIQSDMEVPCRDETEKIDIVRSIAAFGMWFLAAVTLIPMA